MIPQKGTLQLRLLLISSFLFVFQSNAECKSVHPDSTEPIIRVCLVENAKYPVITICGSYRLTFRGYEVATLTDAVVSFTFSSNGIPIARLPNQEVRFSSLIRLEPVGTSFHTEKRDSVVNPPKANLNDYPHEIRIGMQTFPGSMEVSSNNDGTFRLTNFVPLETYLRGVVPNELVNNPTPDEFQACEAQAIAARNYAFYKLSKEDTADFDVYSDTRDQVYSGMEKYKPMADSSIKLTSGVIVEYEGEPARCFFHSTCGGHTESVQHVWQGQPAVPYLSGVSDIDSATGDAYCIYSPQFYWTSTCTRFQLDEMFKDNLAIANPSYEKKIVGGDVTDIKIVDRFDSFRADTMKITTKSGESFFVHGDRTRYFFKSASGNLLRSSLFRISISRDGRRRIQAITLKGQGSGHGVGMCQWGAIGMSRLGYSYRQILLHYYPYTELKKIY